MGGAAVRAYGLEDRPGRRRRPEPTATVTVVSRDGAATVLPPDSALAKAMGQLARLLAHH